MRDQYFDNDWDGYEGDLTVTPWEHARAYTVEASAAIEGYRGEGLSGETIRATVQYDLTCASVRVTLQGGAERDSFVQLSAPSPGRMLSVLEVLARFDPRGRRHGFGCAVAWLAHQLVQSVHDDPRRATHCAQEATP